MSNVEDIANAILIKLTAEEQSILCDCYDDGSIETIFNDFLLPVDIKKHPEKYVEPNKNIAEGKTDEHKTRKDIG